MATSFNPAQSGQSRVFILEGRARADHKPTYMSTVKAGSPSQSFGDVEKIEVPHPTQYDKFLEVGKIRGAEENVTITLTGRYARDVKSEMLRMAKALCPVDIQINFGACKDPTAYNVFDKKVLLEDAVLTNWGAEDFGALGSDERAKIDENVDISAREIYEIVELTLGEKAGSIVTTELLDVVICDTASCGDCDEESSGCDKFFAISTAAGGSGGTPPDVVFSLDKGVSWDAHDIETLGAAEVPSGIACLGSYLFVVSEETESQHYALLSEFDGSTDPDFTEIATGYVAGGGPRAVSVGSAKAFIVGAGGYIYSTEDATAGVTVLDAGTIYTADYNDVDAFSDEFAVAVGDHGRIVKTANGTLWTSVASPIGVGVNFNAVEVISENYWLLGTSAGVLYYTTNGGTSFTTKAFPGSGAGVIRDIESASESVFYMAHDTATPAGRVLRSINGGYDWYVLPEGSGVIPANDQINAIAACQSDADLFVGVGLADDASDGYVVLGSA